MGYEGCEFVFLAAKKYGLWGCMGYERYGFELRGV